MNNVKKTSLLNLLSNLRIKSDNMKNKYNSEENIPKYCLNCSNKIEKNGKFCEFCGVKIKTDVDKSFKKTNLIEIRN